MKEDCKEGKFHFYEKLDEDCRKYFNAPVSHIFKSDALTLTNSFIHNIVCQRKECVAGECKQEVKNGVMFIPICKDTDEECLEKGCKKNDNKCFTKTCNLHINALDTNILQTTFGCL